MSQGEATPSASGASPPDIVRGLATAIDRGESVALATVIRTDRSVPRHAGSKMLVFADGRTTGSVGGGEMEARVRAAAADALADGRPRHLAYTLVDPGTGDPGVCGGEVELYVEPYVASTDVLIVGAGHVGHAVADLANWMGHRPLVWDDRTELLAEFDPAVRAAGTLDEALATATITRRTAVVVVTRNVAVDLEILPSLLATDAGYIGVMGSRRRWDTTRSELLERGVAADLVDRITSPIGIEIDAETPEEIAISIMAQVIAHVRRT